MKKCFLKFTHIAVFTTLVQILPAQIKVHSSGQVSIGTVTAPAGTLRLQVVGGNSTFSSTTSTINSAPTIRGTNSYSTSSLPDYTFYGDDMTGIFHPSGGNLSFTASGSQVLRMFSAGMQGTGYLYVTGSSGTTNPASAPYLRGANTWSTAALPDFTWWGDGGSGLFHPAVNTVGFSTNSTERMRINASGNVGIGITNPTYQLHLSTNSAAKPTSSTWTVASDKRLKSNIIPYTKGLEIIRKIELVSYQYNGLAETSDGEAGIGVIAQDFQKILPNAVKSFTIMDKTERNGENYLGVDFHELFMLYVNAIKELDNQNSELIKQINILQIQVNKLSDNGKLPDVEQEQYSTAKLFQNTPNPFNQQTKIMYYLPAEIKSASVMIFDMQGKLIKSIPVTEYGNASLTINANELSAGMFMYSLIADGKEIDNKRMILTQ